MLILRWGYMPPEIRAAVAPVLYSYLWLLPGWCRCVFVGYSTLHERGEDVPASADAQKEYRQAQIYIHAGWLEATISKRRLDVLHEVLHVPIGPMVDEHNSAIDRLFEDGDAPKFQATLKEHWEKTFEGTVQDLALALLGIPAEALPKVQFIEEEHAEPLEKAS